MCLNLSLVFAYVCFVLYLCLVFALYLCLNFSMYVLFYICVGTDFVVFTWETVYILEEFWNAHYFALGRVWSSFEVGRTNFHSICRNFSTVVVNPFTAPACKTSGVNVARTRLAKQYTFHSCNIYFQCYAFWWKTFHMPVRKEDKKASGFHISHLYWSVLSDTMAVRGLRLLFFRCRCLADLFSFYRYRGKRNQLPVLPLQGYTPVLQQLQLILSVWTNFFGLQRCLGDTVVRILMTCVKNYDVNCHSLTSFCKLGSMHVHRPVCQRNAVDTWRS